MKIILLTIGVAIGLAYPLVLDYVLFGTITPCRTAVKYEDGSTIQHCSVKE